MLLILSKWIDGGACQPAAVPDARDVTREAAHHALLRGSDRHLRQPEYHRRPEFGKQGDGCKGGHRATEDAENRYRLQGVCDPADRCTVAPMTKGIKHHTSPTVR
jgi:hypothetical protein